MGDMNNVIGLVGLIVGSPMVRHDCVILQVITSSGKRGIVVVDDETFLEYKDHPDRFQDGRPILILAGPDLENPHKNCPVKTIRLPGIDE